MARAARCCWYFCDPLSATDEQLYGGGRCPLPTLPGRPYCAAHEARAYRQPGDPYDPAEQPAPLAAPEAAAPAPQRLARQGGKRAALTLAALRRPEGITVQELHALFEQKIGPTGATTARQAIDKLPPRHAGRKADNLGPLPGRGLGHVYRLPPA